MSKPSKRKRNAPIKLYLRPVAMRLAVEWIDKHAFPPDPEQRRAVEVEHRDVLRFIKRMRNHGADSAEKSRLDVERPVAQDFAERFGRLLESHLVGYAVHERIDGQLPPPVSGERAVVEVVLDVRDALRPKRRPQADIDPLEAHLAYERIKRDRPRFVGNPDKYVDSKPSLEMTADHFQVKSKNTVDKAIRVGRAVTSLTEDAKRDRGPGFEILATLVDPGSKTVQFIALPARAPAPTPPPASKPRRKSR